MSISSKEITTILLIENDNETRRLLIQSLRNRNYKILIAFDENNAIEWLLTNEKININLILLNQVKLSVQECQSAIAKIYQQTNVSETIPSIILAEHYGTALEGTEEKIGDNQYIIYLEDSEKLFNLIDRLCLND